ncbi:MAG: hypothetical protein H6739_39700 [Alphaproteobacteria bacterium]|nr:hypothetical protein [Alphaproteobacteria bacterium]
MSIAFATLAALLTASAATPIDPQPPLDPPPAAVEPLAPGLARGAWVDRVPLDLAPAPAGVVPDLALVHDPAYRDGWLGFGWGLSGPSRVERRSATGGVPAFAPGPPRTTDVWRLDGVDLLYNTDTGCWEPEVWDGSCLTWQDQDNTWLWRRDGWRRVYGGGDATWGVIDDPATAGDTALWYLTEVQGPAGEPIRWTWTIDRDLSGSPLLDTARGLPRPERIEYGQAGEVVFEAELRPDPRLDASTGVLGVNSRRIVAVEARHAKQRYSRVSLGYADQADYPSAADAVDCDGQPVSADPAPFQLTLQRIVREASGGRYGGDHVVLRCMTTADQADAWADQTSGVTTQLELPMLVDLEADQDIAWRMHAVNLNGDGLPDLVVLVTACDTYAGNSDPDPDEAWADLGTVQVCNSEAIAWLNQDPNPATTWATHTFNLVEDAAWTARLNAWLSSEPGVPAYAMGDLDRDGWTDLLVTEADAARRLDTDPWTRTIGEDVLSLSASELRRGQLADLNGDGLPDLVTPAWEDAQGTVTLSTWRRNTGDPTQWFDVEEPLAWPLESAVEPEGWAAASTCAAGFPNPAPPSLAATGEAWRAANSRLADLNGDGVTDLALAVYACWSDDDEPDPASAFSRIFYGDGRGGFHDSGLSAGLPFDTDVEDAALWPRLDDRFTLDAFTALDVDRSGAPELLQLAGLDADGLAVLGGAYDRGLVEGFGLVADAPADFSLGISALGSDYPWRSRAAIADFDGDGFPDQLVAALIPADPTQTSPSLDGAIFQVTFRPAQRDTAQGRVIAMTGPWGGTTALDWGFSASYPSENPELSVNLEVLRAQEGEQGLVTYRYRHGFHDGQRFRGFGLVEARRRDGADLHAFDLSVVSPGAWAYGARLRADGTLAAATVNLYGRSDGAGPWYVDALAPYFNPLARRCEVELGHGVGGAQSVTIEDLITTCASAEGAGSLSAAAVSARLGHLPWTDAADLRTVAEAVRGLEPAASVDLGGRLGDPAALDFSDLPTPEDPFGDRAVVTEHPWDSDLPGLPDAPEPSGAWPTELRVTATTWRYDADQRLASAEHHREIGRSDDDLEQHFSWYPFDTAAWGAALLEVETTGPGGGPTLARVERLDLHAQGFGLPERVRQWGDGTDFVELQLDYTATGPFTGQAQAVTRPDGAVETVTVDPLCGVAVEQVDGVGRVRSLTLDALCRVEEERWQGSLITRTFDDLHRVITETVDPDADDAGDADLIVTERAYAPQELPPWEASWGSLRQLTLRNDGRLEAVETDGFGRPTLSTVCTEGEGHPWPWGDWSCDAAQPIRVEALLWTDDGALGYAVEPHLDGWEDPAITGFTWDALGREVAALAPSPAGGHGLTTTVRRPGVASVTDPMGVDTVTTWDSLSTEVSRAGILRVSETRDALGRVEVRRDATGVMTLTGYDSLHRVETVERLGDPSVTPGDDACEHATGDVPLDAACSFVWVHRYDLSRREHTVTDPGGLSTVSRFDAAGRLLDQTVDGQTVVTNTWHDRQSSLPAHVVSTDLQGAVTTETFDGLGRSISLLDLDGETATVWGPAGVDRVDLPAGQSLYIERDVFGQPVATCHPDGWSGACVDPLDTWAYTGLGDVDWHVDADGVETTFGYAPGGFLEELIAGGALRYEAEYDVLGRPIREWQGVAERRTEYDDLSRPVRVEEGPESAPLRWQTWAWADVDRLTSRTLGPVDSGSLITRYTWHDLGWLREVEHPDATTERWFYDALGQARFHQDPAGAVSRTRYDSLGRVVAQDLAGEGPRSWSYATNMSWDGHSALLRVTETDGEGAVWRQWLDGAGRVVGVEDPTGVVERHHIDAGQRWAVEVRDPAGVPLAMTVWLHDPTTGRPLTEWGWFEAPFSGGVTPSRYDFGVPGPADYVVDYGWTDAGRLASVGVGGEQTAYTWVDGRLDTETWDGGVRQRTWRYDGYGELDLSQEVGVDGSVRSTTYGRDALGRVTSVLVDDGASILETRYEGLDARDLPADVVRDWSGVTESSEAWTWDAAGRPVARSLWVDGLTQVTTWAWTADGALEELGLPSGRTLSLDYGWSGNDRLAERMRGPGGDVLVEVLQRDGALRPTALEVDGHGLTLGWDDLGRPTQRAWQGGASWEGVWDDRGRLAWEQFIGPDSDWTADYAWQEPGWLVEQVFTPSEGEIEVRGFTYDEGGRREAVDDGTDVLSTLGWSGALPADFDGVTADRDPWDALEVDPTGALLFRDPAGGLAERETPEGAITTFVRDPAGWPVLAVEPEGERWTTWGLEGALPLEVQTATEDITNLVFEGVWLGQLRGEEGVTRALTDPRGSLLQLGGETLPYAGAFGERAQAPTTLDERYVYAGLERLPDGGLMLARNRALLPASGVFDRPDPLGLAGGLHRARYAENDPLGYVDPIGFTAQPITGSAGGWGSLQSGSLGGLGVQDPCRADPTSCGSSSPWGQGGVLNLSPKRRRGRDDGGAEAEVEPEKGILAFFKRLWGGRGPGSFQKTKSGLVPEYELVVTGRRGLREVLSNVFRRVEGSSVWGCQGSAFAGRLRHFGRSALEDLEAGAWGAAAGGASYLADGLESLPTTADITGHPWARGPLEGILKESSAVAATRDWGVEAYARADGHSASIAQYGAVVGIIGVAVGDYYMPGPGGESRLAQKAEKGAIEVVETLGSRVDLTRLAEAATIPWSSKKVRDAAKKIENSTTKSINVTVDNRDQAGELFLRFYHGNGYRNTTGMTGKKVRKAFDSKKCTYHWDMEDVEHGGRPHLQIHDDQRRVIRIFFDGE